MKQRTTYILLGCGALILILLAAVVVVAVKRKRQQSEEDRYAPVLTDPVIKYGDRGENVKQLQAFLNAKLIHYADLKGGRPQYNGTVINALDVDGIYGKRTRCVTEWWFDREQILLSEIQ